MRIFLFILGLFALFILLFTIFFEFLFQFVVAVAYNAFIFVLAVITAFAV